MAGGRNDYGSEGIRAVGDGASATGGNPGRPRETRVTASFRQNPQSVNHSPSVVRHTRAQLILAAALATSGLGGPPTAVKPEAPRIAIRAPPIGSTLTTLAEVALTRVSSPAPAGRSPRSGNVGDRGGRVRHREGSPIARVWAVPLALLLAFAPAISEAGGRGDGGHSSSHSCSRTRSPRPRRAERSEPSRATMMDHMDGEPGPSPKLPSSQAIKFWPTTASPIAAGASRATPSSPRTIF